MQTATNRKSLPGAARAQARHDTGVRPEFWRVNELIALGIGGRTKINGLLSSGALMRVKIGKTTLIPDASVRALLAGNAGCV